MAAVLIDGLIQGLQLGLLAVGLTLLYGLGGMLNLAHGSLVVAAAIVASLVTGGVGWPVGVAALVGITAAASICLLMDRTVVRAVQRAPGEQRVLLSLLLTLGVALVIDGLLGWRHPSGALSIRIGGGPVEVLGIALRRGSLVAAAISTGVIGLVVLVLRRTTLGRAIRSVIEDETGARLVGVDPDRVRTLVIVGSGVLAGTVAMTLSMTAPVDVRAGFPLTILALVVTVVGGLGSARGALVAGLLLGVVEALSAFHIGTYATSIVLLAAAAATILVRPTGLLGAR